MTDDTGAALKACPFCGGGGAFLDVMRRSLAGQPLDHSPECPCGATIVSPRDLTEAEAIAAWNRRTPSPEMVEVVMESRASLTQCLGLLAEIGDLNGFRGLSDDELGRVWRAVAEGAAATLTKLDSILAEKGEGK